MPRKTASSGAHLDEPGLVRRSQAGDTDAFGSLYDAYVERIYRYIYFRVADDKLAEDITSLVFLKAWEKLDTYRVGASTFIAWLYRIAHNAVIDEYRTRKVTVRLDDTQPTEIHHEDGVDEKIDLQFESEHLRKALHELTEEQQQVLILKFVSGLSTQEIAEQLGKQPGAIRALQMRALQGLARSVKLEGEQVYER
jgi:RNA polymerase sigma-70 factor (ECF subfamily)